MVLSYLFPNSTENTSILPWDLLLLNVSTQSPKQPHSLVHFLKSIYPPWFSSLKCIMLQSQKREVCFSPELSSNTGAVNHHEETTRSCPCDSSLSHFLFPCTFFPFPVMWLQHFKNLYINTAVSQNAMIQSLWPFEKVYNVKNYFSYNTKRHDLPSPPCWRMSARMTYRQWWARLLVPELESKQKYQTTQPVTTVFFTMTCRKNGMPLAHNDVFNGQVW